MLLASTSNEPICLSALFGGSIATSRIQALYIFVHFKTISHLEVFIEHRFYKPFNASSQFTKRSFYLPWIRNFLVFLNNLTRRNENILESPASGLLELVLVQHKLPVRTTVCSSLCMALDEQLYFCKRYIDFFFATFEIYSLSKLLFTSVTVAPSRASVMASTRLSLRTNNKLKYLHKHFCCSFESSIIEHFIYFRPQIENGDEGVSERYCTDLYQNFSNISQHFRFESDFPHPACQSFPYFTIFISIRQNIGIYMKTASLL